MKNLDHNPCPNDPYRIGDDVTNGACHGSRQKILQVLVVTFVLECFLRIFVDGEKQCVECGDSDYIGSVAWVIMKEIPV